MSRLQQLAREREAGVFVHADRCGVDDAIGRSESLAQ
jgi:hypothetical protein